MKKKITVDGKEYILASECGKTKAQKLDDMEYVIVRTENAGVFAGYLKERDGEEATVVNARRLWKWVGASSLSQLAMEGVKKPNDCKFPCEVDKVELTQVIEVIDCTEAARVNISEVPIWAQ